MNWMLQWNVPKIILQARQPAQEVKQWHAIVTLVQGGRDRRIIGAHWLASLHWRIPGAYWPDSLAELVISRPVRSSFSKEIDSVPEGDNQEFPLVFTYMNTQVHAHFHTHMYLNTMNMYPYTQSFSLWDNGSRPQVKKDKSGSTEKECGTQITIIQIGKCHSTKTTQCLPPWKALAGQRFSIARVFIR